MQGILQRETVKVRNKASRMHRGAKQKDIPKDDQSDASRNSQNDVQRDTRKDARKDAQCEMPSVMRKELNR
jgi:hypothetical protein